MILYAQTRLPRTSWICSNIALGVEFPKVIGLSIIPYFSLIRYFINSLLINYYPLSYVISIGLGCIVNHIVSTKFVIDITHVSSYCVILNHPVIGSIMVAAIIFNFFIQLSYYYVENYYICTEFFHAVSSDYLASDLPYFYLTVLYVGKCQN